MSRPKRSEETTRRLRAVLLERARRIVRRDGAAALTMRALAAEAGVSVGLPYKVFADRREIVTEIVRGEIPTLRAALRSWSPRLTAGRSAIISPTSPKRSWTHQPLRSRESFTATISSSHLSLGQQTRPLWVQPGWLVPSAATWSLSNTPGESPDTWTPTPSRSFSPVRCTTC